MGNQVVTGNIDSNCQLSLVGTPHLDSGKWTYGPLKQVPSGDTMVFVAASRDGAAVGFQGSLTYQGPDGTQFLLAFADSWSGENSCTLSVSSGNPSNYSCHCTCNPGDAWKFTSTIIYNG